MTLPFHPIANLFPLIEGPDFDVIVEDMRCSGFREDEHIVMLDGMILDGRNRYRAAVAAGIFPEDIEWRSRWEFMEFSTEGIDGCFTDATIERGPLAFVISKNLNRRHMDTSQRAMVAADIEAFRHGGARKSGDQDANLHLDREGAATAMHVSERSVATAAQVRDHGVTELGDAVRQGHLTVTTAADIATLPAERQSEIVKALPRTPEGKLTPETRKALAPVIKEIRAEKQAEKKERRDSREAELGRKILAMPEKQYGVAIEDFEWDHEPWSRETGMDRHPGNHYPIASDAHTPEEIVARTAERFKCLAEDCVLYMWATIPHAAIAMRVLELRGFKYVTQRVWGKLRNGNGRGPGYWVTGEHEILLIGVRGKVVPPATAHFRSYFEAPVGEHSEKPNQQYEHAEFHFPTLPKIELNARRSRPGWDSWGNEAPHDPETGEVIEYPEEASGTAREAPSTGCGTADESQHVGTQSAPPHFSDETLDLPAFLKRGPDNAVPFGKVEA